MNRIPDQPPAQQPSLDGLRAACPEWEIRYEAALHVWTAEKSGTGRALRFLAGHDLSELENRLVTATTVAP